MTESPFDRQLARRRFDRAAAAFDRHDFVHTATREGLLARLEPMQLDVQTVVDLGSGTGNATAALARRFRGARVLAVDWSLPMLREMSRKRGWLSKHRAIQADAEQLPFAAGSVDLIFANQLLPWTEPPQRVFAEAARVLRENGLLAFATLGPDSLSVLRAAWAEVDQDGHVHAFADMHNVGDALVRAALRDPVLDVDTLTVTYAEPSRLFADLAAVGGRNVLAMRARGLVGRRTFQRLLDALEARREDGLIRIELEIVYGHCWGPGALPQAGEVRVGIGDIGRRRPPGRQR